MSCIACDADDVRAFLLQHCLVYDDVATGGTRAHNRPTRVASCVSEIDRAMADDQRIEIVARALARHRLGHSLLTQSLPSELARSILDKSVERLWPSLTEEAEIVVQALDGMGPQSRPPEPPAQEPETEAKPATAEPALPQAEEAREAKEAEAKPEPSDRPAPESKPAADPPVSRWRVSFEGL